jgi:hypothetical protein
MEDATRDGETGPKMPLAVRLWFVWAFALLAITGLLLGRVVEFIDFSERAPFSLLGIFVMLELAAVLFAAFKDRQSDVPPLPANYDNTRALGNMLYTEYVYPFEIAAVVLLVAIIAAIALTLRRRKDSKYQNPSDQVRVRSRDRVRLVRIPPQTARTTEQP